MKNTRARPFAPELHRRPKSRRSENLIKRKRPAPRSLSPSKSPVCVSAPPFSEQIESNHRAPPSVTIHLIPTPAAFLRRVLLSASNAGVMLGRVRARLRNRADLSKLPRGERYKCAACFTRRRVIETFRARESPRGDERADVTGACVLRPRKIAGSGRDKSSRQARIRLLSPDRICVARR